MIFQKALRAKKRPRAYQMALLVWTSCALFLSTSGIHALSMTNNPATSRAMSFASCASPRFDDFSEKLVGQWHWKQQEVGDNNVASESVTEVMRSCGGAVQGIREIPSMFPSKKDDEGQEDEGYYLNRANDGFLFFDRDGTYSCGPLKLPTAEEEHPPWISSLSFEKMRLILLQNGQTQRQSLVAHRTLANLPMVEETALENMPGDVVWEEIIRCRMSSPTQPWMSNRLKWERYTNPPDVEEAGEDNVESTTGVVVDSWLVDLPGSEVTCVFDDADNSKIWSAGGICRGTGVVKSVMHQYSESDGSLKSVAWCRGNLQGTQ